MAQIFLSYASEDSVFADLVILRLKNQNIDVWIDHRNIQAGEEWLTGIDQGILESDALVVVLTPDSCNSIYVTYEWAFALGNGITVIPLLQKDAEIHPRLEALQFLDFRNQRNGPWDELIDRLKDSGDGATRSLSANEVAIQRLEIRLEQQTELIRDLAQAFRQTPLAKMDPQNETSPIELLSSLEGAWQFEPSGANGYARIIDGDLHVPYCYDGDDGLTAVFYDWSRLGEIWFCRFHWFNEPIHGFAFLHKISTSILEGTWWYDGEVRAPGPPHDLTLGIETRSDETLYGLSKLPPGGNSIRWKRRKVDSYPQWATDYFADPESSRRIFDNS